PLLWQKTFGLDVPSIEPKIAENRVTIGSWLIQKRLVPAARLFGGDVITRVLTGGTAGNCISLKAAVGTMEDRAPRGSRELTQVTMSQPVLRSFVAARGRIAHLLILSAAPNPGAPRPNPCDVPKRGKDCW